MPSDTRESISEGPSRRDFLKSSAAAGAAGAASLSLARSAHAAGSDVLKVGLIGCGGRGTGACRQALRADKHIQLVAMGDAFADRLGSSLRNLKNARDVSDKIDVPQDRQFVGFDAYKQVLDAGVDVVLLATPPHFRPIHLKAAVERGVHVFAEKPVAVDAPGVRSILASCEAAKKQNLSIVSGLCLRYSYGFQDIARQVHTGEIGDVHTLLAHDYRGGIWVKPRQEGWTDMHWQMRNWYHFCWLSGDFNVEQHVHFLDVCAWAMQDQYPVKAIGMGGRHVREGELYGNIYDHHSVLYEYASGTRLVSNTRQWRGCKNRLGAEVIGSRGRANFSERTNGLYTEVDGKRRLYTGENNQFYQTEHDELMASIRSGKPINNGDYMAKSTLLAIMGRMATYTGQEITWEMAMNSKEDLSPPKYEWGPLKVRPIAMPGKTKFV